MPFSTVQSMLIVCISISRNYCADVCVSTSQARKEYPSASAISLQRSILPLVHAPLDRRKQFLVKCDLLRTPQRSKSKIWTNARVIPRALKRQAPLLLIIFFWLETSADDETQYYSKALASPLGKQVYEFYTSSQKQVKQIHEEAMRIAEHQKNSEQHKSSGQETSTEGSASQS
jgi:hypothetical protein